ncbi:nucleotidyltransferase domain-containing protein [candidate division KSB1 bacterium]|nr:nucleotidyltransferase domain-containing protein [candidate division KSB1 bacterium]
MASQPDYLKIARDFISTLKKHQIKLTRAILFGSHPKGTATPWSDIDLALVSENFSGIPFYDRQQLNPFILQVSSSIEVHPFRPEDFTPDNPFVAEIIQTGTQLPV